MWWPKTAAHSKKGGYHMKIGYDVNTAGINRKELVKAISQELGMDSRYLGMPSVAYQVGEYTIAKDGTVSGPDNRDLIANLQGLHSFIPTSEEYDAPTETADEKETPAFEDLPLTMEEELGLGIQRRDPMGEDGMQADDIPESDEADASETEAEVHSLTIEMPKDGFTETTIANLRKLVESKASLIKKSIGTDSLNIEETDTTLLFPWFSFGTDASNIEAYTQLVTALCTMAKEQKRITAKEKPVDNEKYAFRCFLLRLGFIGSEYKHARKVLMANMEGNGAFKSGQRNEPAIDEPQTNTTDTASETHTQGETQTENSADIKASA